MDLDVIPAARTSAPNVHQVVDLRAVTQLIATSLDGVERKASCTRDHRKTAVPDHLGLGTRPQPRHTLIHRALERDEFRADERLGSHVTNRSCRSRPGDPVDPESDSSDQLSDSRALTCAPANAAKTAARHSRRQVPTTKSGMPNVRCSSSTFSALCVSESVRCTSSRFDSRDRVFPVYIAKMRRMLLLLALTSCDRIFGLDPINEPAPDAITDANVVVVHYSQHWYDFDSDHITMKAFTREFPPEQLSNVTVTLADGTPRDVTYDDTKLTFTTPHVGDAYTLRAMTPIGQRTFELTASAPELVERYSSPPDHAMAAANTTIRLTVPVRGIGTEDIVTLGSWSRHTAPVAHPFTIDVSSIPAADELPLGALDHAAVYYTSTVVASGLPTYEHVETFGKSFDVSTVDGTSTSKTILTATGALTECTKVIADGATEAARNQAAVPFSVADSGTWAIVESPSFDTALLAPTLAIADGTNDKTNPTMTSARYDDVYGLANASVLMTTGAANLDGEVSTSTLAVPAPNDCTTDTTIPVGAVQLPTNASFARIAISKNQQVLSLPTDPTLTLQWQAASGTADGYIIFIDLLVAGNFVNVGQITTTDPRMTATIPITDFPSGNNYRITIVAGLGFPRAASDGDFATVSTTAIGLGKYTTPPFVIQ